MGEYRVNLKLRRRGEAALEGNYIELKSEDFDDDIEYCQAIASEVYDILTADREYTSQKEDGDVPE